jgi:hypothetical protein
MPIERKGPAVAEREYVTLRHRDSRREIVRAKSAAPFYPDYDVLTVDGRVNAKATATAQTTPKEK